MVEYRGGLKLLFLLLLVAHCLAPTQKPNWDLGFVTFLLLTGLDYWRGIPTRWPLGAYHVIAHCAVFLVVLAAYHIKTPLPAVLLLKCALE